MALTPSSGLAQTEVSTAAIRFLAEHGYESTTAGDLADAVGMSRSTFFRRFGTKDDVIFADHDLALERLHAELTESNQATADTLSRATAQVFHLLTRDTEAAVLRSELLRHTPSLRARELVITHRYERVYVDYLTRQATAGAPDWALHALAAGVVAIHNSMLRTWLRDPDPRVIALLDASLRELTSRFSPWFGGVDQGAARVVVAAFDASVPPEAVLTAVRDAL